MHNYFLKVLSKGVLDMHPLVAKDCIMKTLSADFFQFW